MEPPKRTCGTPAPKDDFKTCCGKGCHGEEKKEAPKCEPTTCTPAQCDPCKPAKPSGPGCGC